MSAPLEFRPARPPLRELWPTAFLSLLLLLLAPTLLRRGSSGSMAGLAGLGLLVIGGWWLWFRQRVPGDPVLHVDKRGLRYARGGRERALAWREVGAIEVDHFLRRMRFVPKDGGRAIEMHPYMVTDDGRAWLGLIEEYWTAPEPEQ